MKRDVQIVILSIQNAGGDPEAILTKTIGRYCFEEECHKVGYPGEGETAHVGGGYGF